VTDPADTEPTASEHPLERAHRFFQKAAPVIREVNETIERHGGLEQVRDKVVERAGELVQKVDEVVANATAIEGEVIERDAAATPAASSPTAAADPGFTPAPEPARRTVRWVAIGVVAAAATYGALRLQRRD
jgi:hypothetical protein